MKRGLKVIFIELLVTEGEKVTTVTPMKRGLKVVVAPQRFQGVAVLQPLPR